MQNGEDSWKWRASRDGSYLLKEAYNCLTTTINTSAGWQDQNSKKAFELVWKKAAPLKAAATAWSALWDRLPTKENLKRRNILRANEEIMCTCCGEVEETNNHFFLVCNFTHSIWSTILRWLNVQWVPYNQVNY